MSPAGLVSLTVGLTGGAAIAQRIIERKRRRRLRQLASEWRMNFNAGDQLRLAARVAHCFPIPGAANVTVGDVIYGIDGDVYRYIFTAEYTLGVLRTKRRHVRVACFAEPRDRNSPRPPEAVVLAPLQLSLLEQYRAFSPPANKISGIS
jgi:hypothetical protein